MGFIGFVLLAGAALLVYSAATGSSPLDVLRAFLRGDPVPAPAYVIDVVSAAPSGGGGVQLAGLSGGGTAGMIRPLSSWRVSSPFGPRNGRMHEGVDVMAPTGTPIRAAKAGRVIAAGLSGGAGIRVNVDHGNGLVTKYFHMSRIATSVGASVGQGQVLGYVGSTGNSSGPHLHFEVHVNGRPQNPGGYV
jgi:murein DD-endopeptidase MepM/ murein hydrolase activator NlpD